MASALKLTTLSKLSLNPGGMNISACLMMRQVGKQKLGSADATNLNILNFCAWITAKGAERHCRDTEIGAENSISR